MYGKFIVDKGGTISINLYLIKYNFYLIDIAVCGAKLH